MRTWLATHLACYHRAMRSVRRLAIGVIVAIVIGAPLMETFDRWDQTFQDGNDTEINLVIVALCVGVGLALAGASLAHVRRSARSGCRIALTPPSTLSTRPTLSPPIPNSRPPTPLRV